MQSSRHRATILGLTFAVFLTGFVGSGVGGARAQGSLLSDALERIGVVVQNVLSALNIIDAADDNATDVREASAKLKPKIHELLRYLDTYGDWTHVQVLMEEGDDRPPPPAACLQGLQCTAEGHPCPDNQRGIQENGCRGGDCVLCEESRSPPRPSRAACVDSDGGGNTAVKGTTVLKRPDGGTIREHTDACEGIGNIREGTCSRTDTTQPARILVTTVACEGGTRCVDGSCTSEGPTVGGTCGDGICTESENKLLARVCPGCARPRAGEIPPNCTCSGGGPVCTTDCGVSSPAVASNSVCEYGEPNVCPDCVAAQTCRQPCRQGNRSFPADCRGTVTPTLITNCPQKFSCDVSYGKDGQPRRIAIECGFAPGSTAKLEKSGACGKKRADGTMDGVCYRCVVAPPVDVPPPPRSCPDGSAPYDQLPCKGSNDRCNLAIQVSDGCMRCGANCGSCSYCKATTGKTPFNCDNEQFCGAAGQCTDTDGGQNYQQRGTANPGNGQKRTDYCVQDFLPGGSNGAFVDGDARIHEFWCNTTSGQQSELTGQLKEATDRCPLRNRCVDGACIADWEMPVAQCSDTDGLDPLTAGELSIAGTPKFRDTCRYGNTMEEWDCNNGILVRKFLSCPEGMVCKPHWAFCTPAGADTEQGYCGDRICQQKEHIPCFGESPPNATLLLKPLIKDLCPSDCENFRCEGITWSRDIEAEMAYLTAQATRASADPLSQPLSCPVVQPCGYPDGGCKNYQIVTGKDANGCLQTQCRALCTKTSRNVSLGINNNSPDPSYIVRASPTPAFSGLHIFDAAESKYWPIYSETPCSSDGDEQVRCRGKEGDFCGGGAYGMVICRRDLFCFNNALGHGTCTSRSIIR